jgi:hypothetical protein
MLLARSDLLEQDVLSAGDGNVVTINLRAFSLFWYPRVIAAITKKKT